MYTALIGYVCLFVLGLVQALRPRQSYGLLKASWKQDVLWVLGNDQLSPRLLAWMQFAPSDWIEAHAPVLLDLTRKPALLQFLVGAVVVDFSRYWVHRLSHRIPILWELHKAHHSSTELTAISTYRGGFFDIRAVRTSARSFFSGIGSSGPFTPARPRPRRSVSKARRDFRPVTWLDFSTR